MALLSRSLGDRPEGPGNRSLAYLLRIIRRLAAGARRSVHQFAMCALALVLSAGAAHGLGPDLAPFVGTWKFQAGSSSSIECPGVGPFTTLLGGTRASLYPGTVSDLIFEIGCRCRVAVNIDGSQLKLAGPQSCVLVNRAIPTSGTLQEVTLASNVDGTLGFTLRGTDSVLSLYGTQTCVPGASWGTGVLARASATPVTCGDDVTAVGVIPYAPSGPADCVVGAGQEGLRIEMRDEDQPACSDESGTRGEGAWVLPDDVRERAPACERRSGVTTLRFCRVDGALFRPLPLGADASQAFAVLKLGDRCPAGAVEVSKLIDNEDTPGTGRSLVIGNPGMNVVQSDPAIGTTTTLVFCYFRGAAPAPAQQTSGAEFPDLGFPYAVFHRYGDLQPSWVLAKAWQYSNDEDGVRTRNSYQGPDATTVEEFGQVIENPGNDTIFNMARVR